MLELLNQQRALQHFSGLVFSHPLKMFLYKQDCPGLYSETQTNSDKSNTIKCDGKPPTYSPLDGVNCRAAAAGVCAVVGMHRLFIGDA